MQLLHDTLLEIKPLYEDTIKQAWQRIDNLTKPIGSLGKLEKIAAQMAGITGILHSEIHKKSIVIMCADNGVVDEGVSACPQNVTATVTENFTKKITGVAVLGGYAGSDLTVVDIGVKADFNNPAILNRKMMYGTKNMLKEPAMTRDEAMRAIEIGIEIVDDLVKKGCDLLGTGEMGVGNTATSAAVLSVLSGLGIETVTGKGAGLTQQQFENKKNVLQQAITLHQPDRNDVIDVLSKIGGLDIAGLCGCFLGAAKNRVPIVIDGFISSVAALCAYRLNNLVKYYMFPSHLSAEPGTGYVMQELELEPYLHLDMRLGEGSGCPMAFYIIESALEMMNKMGTFEEAKVEHETYVDIR